MLWACPGIIETKPVVHGLQIPAHGSVEQETNKLLLFNVTALINTTPLKPERANNT